MGFFSLQLTVENLLKSINVNAPPTNTTASSNPSAAKQPYEFDACPVLLAMVRSLVAQVSVSSFTFIISKSVILESRALGILRLGCSEILPLLVSTKGGVSRLRSIGGIPFVPMRHSLSSIHRKANLVKHPTLFSRFPLAISGLDRLTECSDPSGNNSCQTSIVYLLSLSHFSEEHLQRRTNVAHYRFSDR